MSQMYTPLEIIGGGPAGLAAGILLRQQGVPVHIHEASSYPRHRVCGEFLCGLEPSLVSRLGLNDVFRRATVNRSCVWMGREGRILHRASLPDPVFGLSRVAMDSAMAAEFGRLGGHLVTSSRAAREPAEARVLACGRPVSSGARWGGLKAHFDGLELLSDLEIHLGDGGYVGLAGIECGQVNACGLFPASAFSEERVPAHGRLAAACRAIGLPALAARLGSAVLHPDSVVGCTRFVPGWQRQTDPRALAIGDALAIIPPFTGNGMTMAIEAAVAVTGPLVGYARGAADWTATVRMARALLHERFAGRLRTAGWLQPMLVHPAAQSLLGLLSRTGLLPFTPFFRLTH